MILRTLKLVGSEFAEVLSLTLIEKDSKGCYHSLCRIRVPISWLSDSRHFCYSVDCTERGYGYVPKEVFHLKNFLELDHWRKEIDSYEDFVLGRL